MVLHLKYTWLPIVIITLQFLLHVELPPVYFSDSKSTYQLDSKRKVLSAELNWFRSNHWHYQWNDCPALVGTAFSQHHVIITR